MCSGEDLQHLRSHGCEPLLPEALLHLQEVQAIVNSSVSCSLLSSYAVAQQALYASSSLLRRLVGVRPVDFDLFVFVKELKTPNGRLPHC